MLAAELITSLARNAPLIICANSCASFLRPSPITHLSPQHGSTQLGAPGRLPPFALLSFAPRRA